MNNLLESPGIEVKDAVPSFSRLYSGENSISLCEAAGEGRFGGDICDTGWIYARPSYLGEAGNGDDASVLPSVVIRPIFTKETVTCLPCATSCPTLRSCRILTGAFNGSWTSERNSGADRRF